MLVKEKVGKLDIMVSLRTAMKLSQTTIDDLAGPVDASAPVSKRTARQAGANKRRKVAPKNCSIEKSQLAAWQVAKTSQSSVVSTKMKAPSSSSSSWSIECQAAQIGVQKNKQSQNVYIQQSRIINSETDLPVGLGLFAGKAIKKGGFICNYGGVLTAAQDVKYLDPTYIVEYEYSHKGFKLSGNSESGDLGIYANAVHPDCENIEQNASFCLKDKSLVASSSCFSTAIEASPSRKRKKQGLYAPGDRAVFPIKALRDLKQHDEIIVNYGANYWRTMEQWFSQPVEKSEAVIRREARMKARESRIGA